MKKNYKITLQYDGTRYDGWQRQGNTDNTIQGKLEAVLKKLAGAEVEIDGSGRTDAGVHALGQVANFRLEETIEDQQMTAAYVKDYLNRYLPEDIAVIQCEEVGERFHSRLNASKKTYVYHIEMSDKKDVFRRKYVYGMGKQLDVARMEEAAACLIGEHDFASFMTGKKTKKSTVRTMDSVEIKVQGTELTITYTANGFLYNMVRILTGTLIEVGLGKTRPGLVADILKAKDRQAAGYTAPAEGLFLKSVEYGE